MKILVYQCTKQHSRNQVLGNHCIDSPRYLMLKRELLSLSLCLRGMSFCSGVTLAKLDTNIVKTETSKLSLGIITSEGFSIFSNCVILMFY